MRATTSGAAFAAASAAMVRGVDGSSTVHMLLTDCLRLLAADTSGVLVRVDEELDLLAASSHQAVDLELYQSQLESGPCVETIDRGESVLAAGRAELVERWPAFGEAMSAAGFQMVHASPMRWHDRVLGGMNLFWREARALSAEEVELAQAFADISTLALMQAPAPVDQAAVTEMLRAALQGRVVIERAKGVLAQTERLEVDEAFARLVQISEETTRSLAEAAQAVLMGIVTARDQPFPPPGEPRLSPAGHCSARAPQTEST